MHLDQPELFAQLDPQNMLAEIDGLPAQLEHGWQLGQTYTLPPGDGLRQIVIAGMGGSAIAADLLLSYAAPDLRLPTVVLRNYDLPGWARGPETLLIASSHSGNTEETLAAFAQAQVRGCRIMAVCTGGDLAQQAAAAGYPVWTFEHHGQPRAAVGYSFGLLLAAFARLALIPAPAAELADALAEMRRQQAYIKAEAPLSRNPAKRMAGQMVGRVVSVFGSDHLEPVARRWKGQVNELAKAWGQFEALPEADHNTLAGTEQPRGLLPNIMTVFLRGRLCQPRNQLRANLTKQAMMLEGLCTDYADARGATRLAQQWTLLHFGDYSAYYLAMIYAQDPTPIDSLQSFKEEMKKSS